MLDNLRLGSTTTSVTLTPANTNITSNRTLPISTTTGFNTLTEQRINASVKNATSSRKYGSGSGKKGVLYNYCAASAGTICSASNTANASQDICPKGWRLPTGTSSGEYQNLYNKYGNNTNFRNALSIAAAGVARDDGISWSDQASVWTASNAPEFSGRETSMSVLYDQYSGASFRMTVWSRSYGNSVRCLKK